MITSEELNRMVQEIQLGKTVVPGEDAEHAKVRRKLTDEIKEIVEAGGVVEFPSELPEI